ncbi:hypothetical protein E5676_scaffold610G00450 [Cucumis melo var. makuwa]|uniref:Uncharacterized protein n=1 Tax=Cucumis melo var. makuwa TaxID=1194695 RepID=A0A5A7U886_CUCMM|nr:hypothetical protein E6C27_scaffold174G00480 [Cucumis melo var. makuwa]TYK24142.1 hypothetical protein E5676_scaffold610G00450 [Cucumis melo var. makuwa]
MGTLTKSSSISRRQVAGEGARVGYRKAIGDGSELEGGKKGEAVEDVGVEGELAVGVFGSEECDTNGGEGKELGELEHDVDVTLGRGGKEKNMGRGYLWFLHGRVTVFG